MKSRIAGTILLVLLLLYPLSMGPAARLTSNTKVYGSDPMALHRLFMYLKIYRPFLGDNVLGRLMAKYTALWVPPPPFGYPTDQLEAGPVVAPGL